MKLKIFNNQYSDIILKPYLRTSLSIAANTMTAQFGSIVIAALVGYYLGSVELAAFGLLIPLVNLFNLSNRMLKNGLQNSASHACGKGNIELAISHLNTVLAVIIIIALIDILAIFFCAEPISEAMGFRGENFWLVGHAKDFLLGFMPCVFFTKLNDILGVCLYIEGNNRLAVASSAVAAITTCALALASVFVFKTGLFGIGLAMSGAALAGLMVTSLHFLTGRSRMKLSPRSINWRLVKEDAYIGLSTLSRELTKIIRDYAANMVLLTAGGYTTVAIYAALQSMGNLVWIPCSGLSSAFSIISAIAYGERDKKLLERIITLWWHIGGGLYLLLMPIFAFFADDLTGIYTRNPDLFEQTYMAALVYTVQFIPGFFTNMWLYYTATERVNFSIVFNFFRSGLTIVAILFMWFITGGTEGLFWLYFTVVESGGSLAIAAAIWHDTGRFPRKITDFLYLKKDYEKPIRKQYRYEVENMEDAVAVSELSQDIMEMSGMDEKLAYRVGLFLEELCTHEVQHTFKENISKADIRVVVYEGEIFIRVRDNGELINPMEWAKMQTDEDEGRFNNISFVLSLATEMKYVSVIGLNNLIVRLKTA